MINFNKSSLFSNEIIKRNNQIKEQFIKLDKSRKELLIEKLDSNARITLLNIIQNSNHIPPDSKIQFTLKLKLRQIMNLTNEITRKNDKNSIISDLQQKASHLFDNVSYFFNFLTKNQANKLINKALHKQGIKSHRLPQITSYKLRTILEELPFGKKVSLSKLLKQHGFATTITDQLFSDTFCFDKINLENIIFDNCEFNWTNLSDLSLKNVIFRNCKILNVSLMNANFKNCSFENCEIREVMFIGAALVDVNVVKSSLISTSFEEASLLDCKFISISAPATHFFEATVINSAILDSNLKDTLFFKSLNQFQIDNKSKLTAIVTKPITAILIDPESRGVSTPKAFIKLDQNANTIPIRINMSPQTVKKDDINQEIEALLKEIGPYDKNKTPIAQLLINKIKDNSSLKSSKILKKAKKLASQVNAFFLPGGEDIPPALYGQEKEPETEYENDYRRSIFELSLIHVSFNKGIPLMGVCRGFQMANIYFGAQLIQHIKGQIGNQKFQLNPLGKKGIYAKIMKNTLTSVCFHHQAVSEKTTATEHLETSVSYKGLVKASELIRSGVAPMILLQFHPEFYRTSTANSIKRELIDSYLNIRISKENEEFWKLLSDSAKTHKAKRLLHNQIKSIHKKTIKQSLKGEF